MFVLHADSRARRSPKPTPAPSWPSRGFARRYRGYLVRGGSPPLVLERILAEPVIQIAIEPATADDRDRFGEAIGRMLVEDPSLQVSSHPGYGSDDPRGDGTATSGDHRGPAANRSRRIVAMGKPEVAYRETIAAPARAEYRYIKQPGGSGQYAVVTLTVAPAPRGSGITFVDETVGGVIPREDDPGRRKGCSRRNQPRRLRQVPGGRRRGEAGRRRVPPRTPRPRLSRSRVLWGSSARCAQPAPSSSSR